MKTEVNYTDEMVAEMVAAYVESTEAAPKAGVVSMLAEKYGKSEKSVIAKLSREGVYQKAPRLSKTGQVPVRKEALVRVISQIVGFNVESLEKASKQDLIRVANALARNYVAEQESA
jgi:hypothetical protein